MSWDKKHYKTIKKWMIERLNSVPFQYKTNCPFDWAATFLPLIVDCSYREDYEAAQATSDAIREFLNGFLKEEDRISETTLLKLPDYVDVYKFKDWISW